MSNLASFTDILGDEICNSQPLSLPSSNGCYESPHTENLIAKYRPPKGAGQHGGFRSVEEIDPKYRDVFSYPFFNIVQSNVIEDALYSDKSMVVCAPTGSGKTVVFEMAIVQLLMELEDQKYNEDFKIIYMAPVKALCTEKLTEWYPKFTKLGLLCIEVTGDTDVDFSQLKPYRMIITTPEKWDMLTRRWRDHKGLVEMVKLFLIDEVHILNDETRGPVLEAVVSRMKTIESSAQSAHRIEQLQQELQGGEASKRSRPRIRFVAVSATVSNPEDVAAWLGTNDKPAVYYKFGDECRPVKLKRIVEGYPCPEGTSIFKFDIILNYKLWHIIQKHHAGKPTLIFCNTRKSVTLTAETLSRELTVSFHPEQKAKLTALASTIKNKKLQSLVMSGVGCHHAGLLFEERMNIERAFRNRDLPILITTTTLAMGVNLPAHLVIIKNTQQYVNGAYQEYSISTVLQMVGRAGRPQFDTEATAVIMTRLADKPRYQSLVGGSEPLQSYLHKRLAENLNSEAALGTVGDVAQCVQWLRSTFLFVRAARDPRRYLSLPQNSPQHLISKKIEELCVKAMNKLASSGLITMDEASCIESTEAGRLMSIFYLDLETMKLIMKIEGTESLERLLWLICESHELADMHLRMDERRCLNTLNRNNTAATIRYPMKGKITTRQMKLNCVIQAILGCLPIPDPSLGQEAMKIMRTADRVCKCLVSYVIRPDLVSHQPQFYSAVLNTLILAKCITAQLWENSPYLSKQLKGIGPTFSTLLATAGKTNFMLLEESHPRDLERIMNKGPPAGNVIRKQVSLLPKYQLMITAVDERTVSMELVLLNQSYLSENMENLTAGEHHKSYIVVGDSSNHLLLLTSFKDKDLISVYDGTIKYELKRKHDLEHKVFAHCISSGFVGIDAHAEYSFNDLEHLIHQKKQTSHENLPIKNTTKKQTCITDTFKERKRKNTNEIDLTHSKEKRKRDYAVIEKFKSLKESFGFCTKEPKVYRPEIRDKIDFALNNEVSKPKTSIDLTRKDVVPINPNSKDLNEDSLHEFNANDIDYDENIDNAQIDSILNDIKNEISKVRSNSNNSIEPMRSNNLHSCDTIKITPYKTNNAKQDSVHLNTKRKSKPLTNKTNNYNFIDLLERNLDITDDEEKSDEAPKQNGFSETIKSYLNKYLQKTEHTNKLPDDNIKKILENTENTIENDTVPQKVNLETLLTEASTTLEHLSRPNTQYSQYEIKEIVEPIGPIKLSNENIIYTDKDKIIGMDIINIENTQNEKQNELKNKESCNGNGQNQHSNDPYLQHTKGASVSYAHENDIFHTDAGTVQQEIDSKTLLTKSSATLKHSSEPGYHYENKEILKYIKPLKQSNNRTHDKDKITDTKAINIVNIGDVKQNEFKSVDFCKSNGNNHVFNDTCGQHKIDALMQFKRTNHINPIVASDNDTTTYGISDDHLTELKTASIENIPSQVNITEKDNPIVSFGSGDDSIQRKIIEFSRSGNFNVEDRYEKIHNNTLHLESNYSNNDPSSSKYLYNENKYPSGTISVLSHSHFDEMEERVNNYSFSAIKIDTCTKDSVRIVRKVKVDLNISEIISREKDNNKKNKCNEKCESKDQSKFNEFIPLRPNKQARNETITVSTKEIASINNFTGIHLEHTLNTRKKECMSTEKNNELDERIPGEEIQDIKVNKDQTKTPKVQYLEQINNIDSEPVNKETANTENNKLKNILDKYNKILGEKTSKNTITPIQVNSNKPSQSYQKSSELKPNRPFKISEIHRIQAPLPKVLIDEKPVDINVYCPKIEANIDILENKSDELDIQYYDQCNSGDNIEIPDYEYSNLEMLNIPVDVDLEPSKDYKIDNSMFDPKTLLQCVVESDDEIIPPPPQFCDESDSTDNVHEITVSENHNQWCADSENNSAVGYDDDFNESIFKDNCDAELTPSKEIETWTLPREDIWEGLDSNPIKSYTVMRKNTPDDDALNVSLPRQERLGKFKFNHKNKFKIRR